MEQPYMKNVRDNASVVGVFTAQACPMCGEMFDTGRIHLCRLRNSFTKQEKGSRRRISNFKHGKVDGKTLLDAVENFCDNNDKISFEHVCRIVYAITEK